MLTVETISLNDITSAAATYHDRAVAVENDIKHLLGEEVFQTGMAGQPGTISYASAVAELKQAKERYENAVERRRIIRQDRDSKAGKLLEEAVLIINTMGEPTI